MRTPYFDLSGFGLSAADAAHLDRVARYGQVVEGIEQWRAVLTALSALEPGPSTESEEDGKLPDLPKGALARRLLEGLEGLVESVTPPPEESLEGFANWLQALLFGDGGLAVLERAQAQKDTEARDLSALAALGETLQSLVLSERIVGARGKVPVDEFLVELLGTIDTTTYNPTDPCTLAAGANLRGQPEHDAAASPIAPWRCSDCPKGFSPLRSWRTPCSRMKSASACAAKDCRWSRGHAATSRLCSMKRRRGPASFSCLRGPTWLTTEKSGNLLRYWNATLALFDTPPPPHIRRGDFRPLADAGSTVELLAAAMRGGELPAASGPSCRNGRA